MTNLPPLPPVQRHHRLAVLRAQGFSEEWLNERKQHVSTRWLEHGGQGPGLNDKLAQEMANMEALGRGETTVYREGVQRIADRFVRAIEQEFGVERPKPIRTETTGLVGAINDVFAFHDAMDVPCLTTPQWPGDERAQLRMDLIREKFEEVRLAFCYVPGTAGREPTDDKVLRYSGETNVDGKLVANYEQLLSIADGIADLIYVLIGSALEFGIPLERVWREVQRANMAKVGGPMREDGKRLKPEGWQPPDIESAVFGPTFDRNDLTDVVDVEITGPAAAELRAIAEHQP